MRNARRRTFSSTFASAACVAAACITTLLAFVAPVAIAPAGADQVADLKTQASQLSEAMVLEQLQIGGYQQQYAAAVARADQDAAQVAATRSQITQDQAHIGQDARVLRHEAVVDYVEDGTTSNNVGPLFEDQTAEGARTEYDQVASGDISLAIDQLRTDRQALTVQEAARQEAEAADQAAQTTAQTMLTKSEGTQTQLQQQSAQVTGELAAAVAQQQAAQAAAAAAAVAAAQARAVAPSTSEIVVGTQSAPVASSGTDPALNSFLQCVVQHESGGDYQIVSANGEYMGAFQFSQSTWNVAARLAGRPDLVGVPPNTASKADQDTLAVALYAADGSSPGTTRAANRGARRPDRPSLDPVR